MSKKEKKNDTIVISKRTLFLVIFLVVIAIAVAIAVPATIHLKEKRGQGGSNEPDKPQDIEKQIGQDGKFYAYLFDTVYYYDDDDIPVDETEEDKKVSNNGVEAVTNCINEAYPISADSDGEEPTTNATTNCISLRSFNGEEDDFQGKIMNSVADFVDVFGRRDPNYDDEFFSDKTLISVVTHMDYCGGGIKRVYLPGAKGNTAKLKIEYESSCDDCEDEMNIYLITATKDEMRNIYAIDEAEYKDTAVKYCHYEVEKKPVIYLYPTETTDVDVELGAPEKLTVSYPKYTDSWKVTASPDGSLVDRTTGRNLYSLYYETDYTTGKGIHDEGFVVKGSEAASFLEEKLARLGLNEREAEEFIIYWLPQLEANAYSYIYFAPAAEIAENMPLNVSPAPETVIRINMEFKALDAPIQVKEQQLPETPIRKGFTLVEWGGTIL